MQPLSAHPIAGEPAIRLGIFLGLFALFAVLEWIVPGHDRPLGRGRRWPGNLALVVLDTVLLRIVFPTAAVGAAMTASVHGWGLARLPPPVLPAWAAIPASVVVLDLAIYGQHVAFHRIGPLWRLHRVHHADLDIDVTTGLRFHPAEILLSMLIKIALVIALGLPAAGVLAFEVTLNATSMFNHANLRLPAWLDRRLRLLIVTPDMHRVHHSARRAETDSNYGFNLACWDRLFATYRPVPQDGYAAMTIGLDGFRDPAEQRLDRLLTQPLRDGTPARKALGI